MISSVIYWFRHESSSYLLFLNIIKLNSRSLKSCHIYTTHHICGDLKLRITREIHKIKYAGLGKSRNFYFNSENPYFAAKDEKESEGISLIFIRSNYCVIKRETYLCTFFVLPQSSSFDAVYPSIVGHA